MEDPKSGRLRLARAGGQPRRFVLVDFPKHPTDIGKIGRIQSQPRRRCIIDYLCSSGVEKAQRRFFFEESEPRNGIRKKNCHRLGWAFAKRIYGRSASIPCAHSPLHGIVWVEGSPELCGRPARASKGCDFGCTMCVNSS